MLMVLTQNLPNSVRLRREPAPASYRAGDGRSAWTRRWKDLVELHCGDMGGVVNMSEAQISLVRRTSAMEVQLESMEARMSECDMTVDLALYNRTSGELRRISETVGTHRIARRRPG